jgi:hypothetical protein
VYPSALSDYRAFAISMAVSSCVSLPCFNASRESSSENFGAMPCDLLESIDQLAAAVKLQTLHTVGRKFGQVGHYGVVHLRGP